MLPASKVSEADILRLSSSASLCAKLPSSTHDLCFTILNRRLRRWFRPAHQYAPGVPALRDCVKIAQVPEFKASLPSMETLLTTNDWNPTIPFRAQVKVETKYGVLEISRRLYLAVQFQEKPVITVEGFLISCLSLFPP